MNRRKATQQMLVAVSIMCVIVTTGFSAVYVGSEKERQANAVEQQTTTTTITTTPTTQTTQAPQFCYYASVPLDKALQDYIINQCNTKGIDPAIVMAMIDRESDYDPSNMGDGGRAYGLMQIHPRWHSERMERLGCTELLDPYHNVTVGIDYLAELYQKYGCDYGKALTAYNRGNYAGTVTQYAKSVINKANAMEGYKWTN